MNLKNFFKRKKKKPVLYNQFNIPIKRPISQKKKRKQKTYRLQRPTIFTNEEMKEILQNEFINENESK